MTVLVTVELGTGVEVSVRVGVNGAVGVPVPVGVTVAVAAGVGVKPLSPKATRRIFIATQSEMNRYVLVGSTNRPHARMNCAAVASPSSPLKPGIPVPATRVMIPLAKSTTRTRGVDDSLTYNFPLSSNARRSGPLIFAKIAGPPSPVDPHEPVPAIVVMMFVARVSLRTRQLDLSATYTLPASSTTTEAGLLMFVCSGGSPSPLKKNCPVPINVESIPSLNFRIR